MAYELITNRDSPNYSTPSSYRQLTGWARQIKGITIHHWDDPAKNPTFTSTVNYLCREGGNTSAHIVATGTNRQVAWIVDAANVAWHAGSNQGNAETIGIECDPRCRDEDYDVVAEVIADIWKAYGVLPLYPHKHWYNTSCPGNWDLNRLNKLALEKFNGGGSMANITRAEAKALQNVMRVLNSEAKGWDRTKTHKGDYDEREINYLVGMGVNAVEAIARYSQQAWDEGGAYRSTKDTWKAAFDEKPGLQKKVSDMAAEVTKLKDALAKAPMDTSEAEKKLDQFKVALEAVLEDK